MLLEAAEAPDAVEAPPEETAGEGSEPPVELPKQPMSRSERRGMVVEFMGGGARPGPNRRQPRQGQGASAAPRPGRRPEGEGATLRSRRSAERDPPAMPRRSPMTSSKITCPGCERWGVTRHRACAERANGCQTRICERCARDHDYCPNCEKQRLGMFSRGRQEHRDQGRESGELYRSRSRARGQSRRPSRRPRTPSPRAPAASPRRAPATGSGVRLPSREEMERRLAVALMNIHDDLREERAQTR